MLSKMLPLTSAFFPSGPVMTNLERMVASRAIGNSVIAQLSSEISLEKTIFEISNLHSPNVWILSAAIILMYGQYKFNEGTKLQNIEVYNKYSNFIRQFMVIIFLVFTRDIENAI
jgi:hypothetical protein